MRIAGIGDPHGSLDKIKALGLEDENLEAILVTGDLGAANKARERFFTNIERQKDGKKPLESTPAFRRACYMEAYRSSMAVMRYLSRIAPTYTIYGNVEYDNKDVRDIEKEIGKELPKLTDDLQGIGVRVINNRIARIGDLRVGGLRYFVDTNWVKDFKPGDYQKRMKRAKRQSDKARRVLKWFDEVDILMCHQPPYGILDKVGGAAPKHWHGLHAGSKPILKYIQDTTPTQVFCGHIHEGEGRKKVGKTTVHNLGVGSAVILEVQPRE